MSGLDKPAAWTLRECLVNWALCFGVLHCTILFSIKGHCYEGFGGHRGCLLRLGGSVSQR